MSRLGPRARRFISDRVDEHAAEIDAVVLQNQVAIADDSAPETLHHLATAAEGAFYAMDDDSEPIATGAGRAYDELADALDAIIDEQVALACFDVIEHADDWAADWDRDPEDFEAAKREAREWLQTHTDAAKRAGVLDALEVRA